MGLDEVIKQKSNIVCFRCGCMINTGDRMVNLSVSIETPEADNSLKTIESNAVSSLCFGCASVLLCESIFCEPSLMTPQAKKPLVDEIIEID